MQMIYNGPYFKDLIVIRQMLPFKLVVQLESEETRTLKVNFRKFICKLQ